MKTGLVGVALIFSAALTGPIHAADTCEEILQTQGNKGWILPGSFVAGRESLYVHDTDGLRVSITFEPSETIYRPGEARTFSLQYDPSKYLPGSLIRRALGRERLNFSERDVRSFGNNTYVSGIGEVVEVFLKDPSDTARVKSDGPLMLISLKTGKIYFYPAGSDASHFTPMSLALGLWTETQQRLGKSFRGSWRISDKSLSESNR